MISQLRVCIKYAVEMFPTVWTNIWIIFVAIFRAVRTGGARFLPLKEENRGKKGQYITIVPSQIFGHSDVPDKIE